MRFPRVAARRVVLGALCTLLAVQPLLGVGPAQAAAARSGQVEHEPSSSDLARQQAQVAKLTAEEKRTAAGVDDTVETVDAAAALAGHALEDYSVAIRQLQARQLIAQNDQTILEQAQRAVDSSREALGQWARQAYRSGTGLALNPTLNSMFQARDGDDLSTDLVVLNRIGLSRDQTLIAVQHDQAEASAAADTAATASQVAVDAAIKATADHNAADAAVAVQRRLLGIQETALAQAHSATATAKDALAQARKAQRVSNGTGSGSGSGSGSGAGKSNQVTGPVGSCTGGPVGQYPNGKIPIAALCPLWGGSNQYLRADAAFAYDRLSHAYADRFGKPICITDSYRTYASQVDLYARKPNLAAVPGTSNHGWGTAVDLCGGIESFGTVQHQWMLVNAPLYGWFHPGWAEPSGSRPEPWHWEFGG